MPSEFVSQSSKQALVATFGLLCCFSLPMERKKRKGIFSPTCLNFLCFLLNLMRFLYLLLLPVKLSLNIDVEMERFPLLPIIPFSPLDLKVKD